MTWHDLALALRWFETPPKVPTGITYSQPIEEWTVYAVARRLLALWQPCRYCADPVTGDRVNRDCFRCSGTGIMPSDKWPDWRGNGPTVGARGLYRYLFESEPGGLR